jgi:hypothetical protein
MFEIEEIKIMLIIFILSEKKSHQIPRAGGYKSSNRDSRCHLNLRGEH